VVGNSQVVGGRDSKSAKCDQGVTLAESTIHISYCIFTAIFVLCGSFFSEDSVQHPVTVTLVFFVKPPPHIVERGL